ncbi:MAG: ribosome maturation factor RimP [Pseudomonadota bacterium]
MRASNPAEERVIALIEPAAEELGYRIVRVRLLGNRRKTLQIMAERQSDGLFGADDCRALSRAIAVPLEPVEYETLEVSSPGIDRPLMRLEDFARFAGHEAKVETVAMIDNRKRFRGTIAGVDGDEVRLKLPEGDEVRFKLAAISDARLVLTDRLIEEDLRRAKTAAEQDDKKRKLQ